MSLAALVGLNEKISGSISYVSRQNFPRTSAVPVAIRAVEVRRQIQYTVVSNLSVGLQGFLQLYRGPGDPSASSACFKLVYGLMLGFHSLDTSI
jgi:hypothetical protein